jgi:alanyl-tRNA synthetase
MEVADTCRPLAGLWVHRGVVRSGRLRAGDEVQVTVDRERRDAIRRHHTATHLLHAALRELLGPHAVQKGSRVGPDSLRFDFAHFEPLTAEQIDQLERAVTAMVVADQEVTTTETTYDEARRAGAMAIFEENYGEVVRLVQISRVSQELCGGTHVDRSGQIGPFFVTAESGIAAGVRRIEAVAGLQAVAQAAQQRATIESVARLLKAGPDELIDKLTKLIKRDKELGREIERLKRDMAGADGDLMARVRTINGIEVLGARIGVGDPAALRDTADKIRARLGSGVVCLGGEHHGKAAIVVAVSKDLTDRLDANQLIKGVSARVGGKGGGRSDLAQAGGPDPSGLDEAVGSIYDAVADASS